MIPNIVEKKAFQVVGMHYKGTNSNGEIPELWSKFINRIGEIPNRQSKQECFGVCWSDSCDDKEFNYVACVEAGESIDIPAGMVSKIIPAGKYAVFSHIGSLDTLQETYANIYKKWAPEQKLRVDSSGIDFELYNEEFKMNEPDSILYLYVPLK